MLLAAVLVGAQQNPGHGSIRGTLKLPDGLPAVGIRVAAMAVPDASLPANDAVSLVSLAESDANGSYRLENIPAGRYYLTAGLLSELTYYPEGFDQAKARVIVITPGATLSGYDFIPGAFPITVKGRVVLDPSSETPVQRMELSGPQRMVVGIRADGSFEIARLVPGEYTISPVPPVSFNSTTGQSVVYRLQSVVYGNTRTDARPVKIGSLVQSDLTVTFAAISLAGLPPVKISGRVVNVAREAPPLNTKVWLMSATPGLSSREALVTADNSFEFVDIPPGIYRLYLSNLAQAQWLFPTITALNDATDANIDLRNNPFPELPVGSYSAVFATNNPVTVRGRLTQAPTQIRAGAPGHYFRVDVSDEVTGVVIPWAGYASALEPELLRLKVGDNVTFSGTGTRDGTMRFSINSSERAPASINGVPIPPR
jgi:hypothetical protein